MKKSNFLSMLILSFVLMITNISCSKDDTTPSGGTNTVSITDFAFTASAKTVAKGTTITWTNFGATAHTVTSDDGTSFDSGSIAPGGTFTHTFSTSGSFPYHCDFHSSMTGTITVSP